ncbi:MAG TPA: thiamine phosphate synthase [Abditibacteriaceae bacterium]
MIVQHLHHTNGATASNRLRGLYVITDERMGGGHLAMARAALLGGASVIQLRDKPARPRSRADALHLAVELRRLTHEHNALFIINDDAELARECGADGVHLGPGDMPVEEARMLLGSDFIIGASCGTPEEATAAERDGATYIGAGAIFGTSTKSDAGDAIGLDALRAIVAATSLPVAAIGGVNGGNIRSTIEAGAAMACVVSAIGMAGDENAMIAATRALVTVAQF